MFWSLSARPVDPCDVSQEDDINPDLPARHPRDDNALRPLPHASRVAGDGDAQEAAPSHPRPRLRRAPPEAWEGCGANPARPLVRASPSWGRSGRSGALPSRSHRARVLLRVLVRLAPVAGDAEGLEVRRIEAPAGRCPHRDDVVHNPGRPRAPGAPGCVARMEVERRCQAASYPRSVALGRWSRGLAWSAQRPAMTSAGHPGSMHGRRGRFPIASPSGLVGERERRPPRVNRSPFFRATSPARCRPQPSCRARSLHPSGE